LTNATAPPWHLVVAKASLRIEDPLGRCPAAKWHSEEAYTFINVSSGGSRSWKLSVPEEFHVHLQCPERDIVHASIWSAAGNVYSSSALCRVRYG
jgi:hypothetical protein